MVWNWVNFKTKPLALTYESMGHESSAITANSAMKGIRYEISKTLSPFLQLTTVNFKDNSSKSSQYFSTLSFKNSVFQFCFDTNRSYQFKSSIITGPFINKFHSIVSSEKEVYSQFESIYNSLFYNIGIRLIRPTFHASNLVYIVNCCKALGKCCFGFEIVGMNNQIGIGLSARAEKGSSVCFANLQRFNLLTLSYYRRIYKNIELAFEVKKSSEFFSSAAGLRLKNYKSEIKANLDNKLRFGFTWDEKLTENLKIDFNLECDGDDFNYGVGMTLDG